VGPWAFCDNFETGNGAGWTVRQGPVQNFGVASDGTKVYSQSDSTASQLYISQGGSAWMDSTVEASLKPTKFSTNTSAAMATLWGHYDSTWGADCGYYVALRGDGKAALGKRVAGVNSALGGPVAVAGGIAAGTWYDVKLEFVGTTINAYVGGTLLLTQTDTSCDAGSVGVGSVGASFEVDDVRVTAPVTNTCVQDWRNTTCGAFCTYEAGVQSDRAGCGAYLDCYAAHGCSPETCGGQDDVCGVNVLNPWGTASKEVADQVFKCLGCAGSVDCAKAKYYNGTVCADGNPCTWGDTCQNKACVPDPNRNTQCSAADQCHDVGTCDATSGICSNPAKVDGTGCDDGAACTKGDHCTAGTCAGTTYNCDSMLACEVGTCNGDGSCTYSPTQGSCAIAGVCYADGATAPTMPCQACNAATSQTAWTSKPDGTACDDNKACTTGETCSGGSCGGGQLDACDDGDPCTADFCDSSSGCTSELLNTEACVAARAAGGQGQTPLIVPFVKCVANLGTGTGAPPGSQYNYLAIFGYTSGATSNLTIALGDSNNITTNGQGCPVDYQPPTWFQAGTKNGAFSIPFYETDTVIWTVFDQTATANSSSATCDVVDGQVDMGDGTYFTVDPAAHLASTADMQILPTNDNGENGTPGRTEGNFRVSDDGAANYQIPLWVPPAHQGNQPNLSLAYSSNGGDTIAGTGWGLAGLSTISRCPLDFARDKVRSAVTFDDSVDRLCLDGERLVLVNSDSGAIYNHSGAEYRPETDRSTQVVQVGADLHGPTGFVVNFANGIRAYYGHDPNVSGFQGTPDSILSGYRAKVLSPTDSSDPTVKYSDSGEAAVRLSWSIASVEDRFQNRTKYGYFNSQTADQGYAIDFRPQWIDWGNGHVKFDYQKRLRPHVAYASGLPLDSSYLLSKIAMSSENPAFQRLYRYYLLAYQEDYTGGVVMSTVTECDGADVCKPATYFEWTPGDPEFDRIDTKIQPHIASDSLPYGKIAAADVNGDDRDDILPVFAPVPDQADMVGMVLTPADVAQLANHGNAGIPMVGPCSTVNNANCRIASTSQDAITAFQDFIANGLRTSDLGLTGFPTFLFPMSNSEGTGSGFRQWFDYAPVQAEKADGTRPSPGDTNIAFDWSKRFLFPGPPDGVSDWNWSPTLYVGDVDGDGLPDVLRANQLTQNGPKTFLLATNAGVSPFGLDDPLFMAWGKVLTKWLDQTGTPTSALQVQDDANVYMVDINGDGKVELLSYQSNDTRMYSTTWAMTAAGPTPSTRRVSILASSKKANGYRYQFADVNGDGLVDAIEVPNGGGDVRIAYNTGRDFMPPVAVRLGLLGDGQTNTLVNQSMDQLDDNKGTAVDPGLRIVDFDSNGRADLLFMGNGCFNDGNAKTIDGQSISPVPRSNPLVVLLDGSANNFASLAFAPHTSDGVAIPLGASSHDSNTKITGGCGGGYSASQVLDINGDGLPDMLQVENNTIVVYVRRGTKPGLLQKVKDGFGHSVKVSYLSANDSSVHTRVQCSYPQYCSGRGAWVVSSHSYDADTDGQLNFSHQYTGARMSVTGLGWLGMDSHTVTESGSQTKTTTTYDHVSQLETNIYPLAGTPSSTTEVYTLSTGEVITKQTLTPTPTLQVSNDGTLSSISFSETDFTEAERVGSGAVGVKRKVVTQTWFDSTYGYPNYRIRQTGTAGTNGNEVETWRPTFYEPRPDVWLVGQVEREIKDSSMPARSDIGTSASTVTQTTKYERDLPAGSLATGVVKAIIVEPDRTDPTKPNDKSVYLRTDLVRNSRGDVTQTMQTTLDGQTRTTSINYDSTSGGIFPQSVTNALGMTKHFVYHPGFGVVLQETDANGLTALTLYDGFGRFRKTQLPDGRSTRTAYYHQDPPLAMRAQTISDGKTSNIYLDYRGLVVKEDRLFDNGVSEVSRVYDSHGRLNKLSRPYNTQPSSPTDPDGVVRYTTYLYDEMGRPKSIVGPKSNKSWTYQMNSIVFNVVGDDKTQTLVSEFDQSGRLVRKSELVEPSGQGGPFIPTLYGYAPFGRLSVVVDAASHRTRSFYDVRGRRTSLADPDLGNINDVYDGFGQVVSHVHGPRVQSYLYDSLGRVVTETQGDGTNTFAWDTAPNGLGRLDYSLSAYSGGPVGSMSANEVVNRYRYDTHGRMLSQLLEAVDDSYRMDYGYDVEGRRTSIEYPAVSGGRYKVQFSYDGATGFLSTVKDDAFSLWTLGKHNAALQTTSEFFGDGTQRELGFEPERGFLTSDLVRGSDGSKILNLGYSYGTRGILQTRTNYLAGGTESFEHDELGRLTRWGSLAGSWSATYSYDDIGNMTAVSRVGFASGDEQVSFTPGGTNGEPHGLSSMTVTTAAGSTLSNYGYEGPGWQTSGPDRSVVFTDFGLPRQITKTSTGDVWGFLYDASHARVVKQGPTKTTLYVGSLYEKRTTADGVLHVMYVPGEHGVFAQVTQTEGSASRTFEYFHGDHIGSVSTVTGGAAGTIVSRFDPFGARLGAGTPPDLHAVTPVSDVTVGFTGQEGDDEFSLINMNGRIYDPETARFITADPFVGDVGSQGLNRFSYALNSPLKYTDPTGFFSWTDLFPGGSWAWDKFKSWAAPSYNNPGNAGGPSVSLPIGYTHTGASAGNVWQKNYGPRPMPEGPSGTTVDDQAGAGGVDSGGSDGTVEQSYEGCYYAGTYYDSEGQTTDSILVSAGYTGGVSDADIAALGARAGEGAAVGADGKPIILAGGAGVVSGGAAEAGYGPGVGYQGGSGFGVTYSDADGLNVGGFTSSGSFCGSPDNPQTEDEYVVGLGLGAGVGFYATNADKPSDLGGPFNTFTVNLPMITFQIATSPGSDSTWVVSVSIGPQAAGSVSNYKVVTWGTTGK
jgi:RHS repeat-associated protein